MIALVFFSLNVTDLLSCSNSSPLGAISKTAKRKVGVKKKSLIVTKDEEGELLGARNLLFHTDGGVSGEKSQERYFRESLFSQPPCLLFRLPLRAHVYYLHRVVCSRGLLDTPPGDGDGIKMRSTEKLRVIVRNSHRTVDAIPRPMILTILQHISEITTKNSMTRITSLAS